MGFGCARLSIEVFEMWHLLDESKGLTWLLWSLENFARVTSGSRIMSYDCSVSYFSMHCLHPIPCALTPSRIKINMPGSLTWWPRIRWLEHLPKISCEWFTMEQIANWIQNTLKPQVEAYLASFRCDNATKGIRWKYIRLIWNGWSD